jgi:hypothetical protein
VRFHIYKKQQLGGVEQPEDAVVHHSKYQHQMIIQIPHFVQPFVPTRIALVQYGFCPWITKDVTKGASKSEQVMFARPSYSALFDYNNSGTTVGHLFFSG